MVPNLGGFKGIQGDFADYSMFARQHAFCY